MTQLGIETLESERQEVLTGERFGLVTNPSSVRADLTPTVDVLHNGEDWDLRRLFAPEHGIRGNSQSGTGVEAPIDEKTGLPVKTFRNIQNGEFKDLFAGLDAVVYDIQDIGCRFYRHVSTLLAALKGADASDKRLVVLDRPNPIAPAGVSGNIAVPPDGPVMNTHKLPIVPGMTLGELASYCNIENGVNADLTVVPMKGWDHETWFDRTGLPWVQPSPNMPTPTTALLYAGTCLFEATNLSEGRGTTKPFEVVGAPWINADRWASRLNASGLSGVRFRPAYFAPVFSKHERKEIEGVQIHVLDRDLVDPVRVGLVMLVSAFVDHEESEWITYDNRHFIDRLAGGKYLRKLAEETTTGIDLLEVANRAESRWSDDRDNFVDGMSSYQLY